MQFQINLHNKLHCLICNLEKYYFFVNVVLYIALLQGSKQNWACDGTTKTKGAKGLISHCESKQAIVCLSDNNALKVLLVLQLDEHHHHVSRHYSFKIARHMEHLSIDWSNLASIIHLFIHLKHAILMAFVKIHLLKSSILNIQNISIEAPMNYNGNSYTFKI